ncbi:MAG TPA: aspartate ammonia-lyase [Elusimicrobiota bacterium]|nr:aspartate ammonia-lyase [Elusimicrobiota bacterium]
METRREHDSLGEKDVPASAYYGIQTLRAMENFNAGGLPARPAFLEATVRIKKAAAIVHAELGLMAPEMSKAIVTACEEVLAGQWRDQFVVDIFQAGAGTSHNMNVNEVLANRAAELLGGKKGDYSLVHPNDHVNRSQSTNDVVPTAIRLAALTLHKELDGTLQRLSESFRGKSAEFSAVVKSGRTHLQDATPVTLGQEFSGYENCVAKHRDKIFEAADDLRFLGIGGSAVGTGLNTHPDYASRMVFHLSQITGFELEESANLFEAMQSLAPFSALSGALRNLALDMVRIANDFRLLSSGPMTGMAELRLPAVQPGSSIMPGKVNPVMAEMLDMACFQVIGNDTAVSYAVQAGQLELNVMMPLVAFDLCWTLEFFSKALDSFRARCVDGLKADELRCQSYAQRSLALVTALNPHIGYEKAALVAKEVLNSGRSVSDVVLEKGWLSEADLKRIMDLKGMTKPGLTDRSA